MILLLDIGNTFLKWALLDDDAFVDEGEILHADEELAEIFDETWEELDAPEAVYASNVAGEDFASELDAWLEDAWGVSAHYASSEAAAQGVENAYQDPASLGVDRWLAMLAAWNQQRVPLCIIDCGTALTVDAIDEEGRHLGGLIAPGLGMMRDCLFEGTEGIDYDPDAVNESADYLLAHDTQGGVEIGSMYAVLSFIDRVMNDLQRELGEDMQCIVTGGDAPDIVPLLGREVLHRPQLVLEGLALQVLAP